MTRSRKLNRGTTNPKGKARHADNTPSKSQRKTAKRLERRINMFSQHGTNPATMPGYSFTKPGSQNRNKK